MNTKAYGICLYKKKDGVIKILLCKSIKSLDKWGTLKGVAEDYETKIQTAIREFKEESSIDIQAKYFEQYFEQKNEKKDIGIYLVNYDNIPNISKYFFEDKLIDRYLSWENTTAKFFDIDKIPKIKKKQINLINDIIIYLKKR